MSNVSVEDGRRQGTPCFSYSKGAQAVADSGVFEILPLLRRSYDHSLQTKTGKI